MKSNSTVPSPPNVSFPEACVRVTSPEFQLTIEPEEVRNKSSPTDTSPANVPERSSLIVNAVAREFNELPELPALAVLNTISPPAPEPLPCPPCKVNAPPAILLVVPAVVFPAEIVKFFPAAL